MTDIVVFEAMLRRSGVLFERAHDDDSITVTITSRAGMQDEGEPENEGANRGYLNFYTAFTFSPEGALKHVGVWE